MESAASLQTSNTQKTISSLAQQAPAEGAFTDDEIHKTSVFFARLATIYGESKTKTLWGEDEDRLVLMRREWAHKIGEYSFDQLEDIFSRLKERLALGDPDFKWPDVPRILNLINEGKVRSLHTHFPVGLPEPEWRKKQRYECGLIASKTCRAVLNGKACFLEDKPSDQ